MQAVLDRVGVSPRNKKRMWNKNDHGGLVDLTLTLALTLIPTLTLTLTLTLILTSNPNP